MTYQSKNGYSLSVSYADLSTVACVGVLANGGGESFDMHFAKSGLSEE